MSPSNLFHTEEVVADSILEASEHTKVERDLTEPEKPHLKRLPQHSMARSLEPLMHCSKECTVPPLSLILGSWAITEEIRFVDTRTQINAIETRAGAIERCMKKELQVITTKRTCG